MPANDSSSALKTLMLWEVSMMAWGVFETEVTVVLNRVAVTVTASTASLDGPELAAGLGEAEAGAVWA